jgi:hypothetical protein
MPLRQPRLRDLAGSTVKSVARIVFAALCDGINVPGTGVGLKQASCSGFVDEFQGASIAIAVKYQQTGVVASAIPWKDWNKKP